MLFFGDALVFGSPSMAPYRHSRGSSNNHNFQEMKNNEIDFMEVNY